MKLADLLSDWQGTQLENRWNRWIILGLLGIVLLLSLQAFRRERIVVLQPVTLSQEAWVSRDAASQSYKEAWGFYLAQLVGNVTPGSLEFVKQRLQPLLAPQIYQAVMATLQQQSQQIQQNRLTLRFEPRAVEYEAASNKLFVYGHSVEEGVSERCKKSSERTYEFVLQIAHYAPLISALDTYQGAPRNFGNRESARGQTMNYPQYPLFILLLSLSSQAYDIPVVAAKAAPPEKGAANGQPPLADTLVMQPGVNQIVPVSIYHLNRIITPFNDPTVTNSSAVTPEIRQNVLYISPQHEAPITLFITERGEESTALSLTLLPQRIPPREITLTLPSVKHQSALRRQAAKPWEQSQPYVITLRNLLRQLVLGEVPPGYNLVEQRMDKSPVLCQQPGLAFDFSQGQQLLGHHLQVQVGVVINRTAKSIEFRESSCAGYGVTAVAAWPKTALLAGDRSEVYVVQRQQPLQAPVTKRPSLLGDKS